MGRSGQKRAAQSARPRETAGFEPVISGGPVTLARIAADSREVFTHVATALERRIEQLLESNGLSRFHPRNLVDRYREHGLGVDGWQQLAPAPADPQAELAARATADRERWGRERAGQGMRWDPARDAMPVELHAEAKQWALEEANRRVNARSNFFKTCAVLASRHYGKGPFYDEFRRDVIAEAQTIHDEWDARIRLGRNATVENVAAHVARRAEQRRQAIEDIEMMGDGYDEAMRDPDGLAGDAHARETAERERIAAERAVREAREAENARIRAAAIARDEAEREQRQQAQREAAERAEAERQQREAALRARAEEEARYIQDPKHDPRLPEAIAIALAEDGVVQINLLQRRMHIGFERAKALHGVLGDNGLLKTEEPATAQPVAVAAPQVTAPQLTVKPGTQTAEVREFLDEVEQTTGAAAAPAPALAEVIDPAAEPKDMVKAIAKQLGGREWTSDADKRERDEALTKLVESTAPAYRKKWNEDMGEFLHWVGYTPEKTTAERALQLEGDAGFAPQIVQMGSQELIAGAEKGYKLTNASYLAELCATPWRDGYLYILQGDCTDGTEEQPGQQQGVEILNQIALSASEGADSPALQLLAKLRSEHGDEKLRNTLDWEVWYDGWRLFKSGRDKKQLTANGALAFLELVERKLTAKPKTTKKQAAAKAA